MIEQVIKIAQGAGRLILDLYENGVKDVQLKEDKSPLTEADLLSDKFISESLNNQFAWPIVSEESPIAYEQRKDWERYWLVDPLDGTKNFLSRDGQFTVNIALIEKGHPILGVVYVPVSKELYFAQKAQGAYKIDSGGRKAIANNRTNTGLIMARSVFHDSPETEAFCEKHNVIKSVAYGSSTKLCKLAEGLIDVYPRFVGTKEWDTAAGHCILNEANCKLIDMHTQEEMLYSKETIKNNPFIASRNNLDFPT